MKTLSVGAKCFVADGQTDMTKLIARVNPVYFKFFNVRQNILSYSWFTFSRV